MDRDYAGQFSGAAYIPRGKYHSALDDADFERFRRYRNSRTTSAATVDDDARKVAMEGAMKALMELEAEEERRKNAEEYRAGKVKKELKKKMKANAVHAEDLIDDTDARQRNLGCACSIL